MNLPKTVLAGQWNTAGKPGIKAVDFSALKGWEQDEHGKALDAFRLSCHKISEKKKDGPLDPATRGFLHGHTETWKAVCKALPEKTGLEKAGNKDSYHKKARKYFERYFRPYEITPPNNSESLFTGYFETGMAGSRIRQGAFQTPLLSPPADLVNLELGVFDPSLAGQKIRGRVDGKTFRPYHDRAAIEAGALDPEKLAIVWVRDPVEAFFLHVQGSGRVYLEEGGVMRVGFADRNGHPYTSIGKILVERGVLTSRNVSMQSIQAWLRANPDQIRSLLNANRSYIFFREIPARDTQTGPEGAAGVPLTPGRSLAVDRFFHPLGALFWLETRVPEPGKTLSQPFRRLMVAQDTGSAIKGPVRGDIFFGAGRKAAERAGPMKQGGRLIVLLPRPAGV